MGIREGRRTRRQARPGVEGLEGRVVLAVYHAVNVEQLQADVAALAHSTGPNAIVLAPNEYDLTETLQIQDASNLTILGTTNNGGTTRLSEGGRSRIFEIDGGSVTLSGLVVTEGSSVAQGAGIDAHDSDLTINNCSILGNAASQSGGGIAVQGGRLALSSSRVRGNTAGGQAAGSGGGIAATDADVSLLNSLVNANLAVGDDAATHSGANGAGAGIAAQGGTLTLVNTSVSNNTALAVTTGAGANSAGGAVAASGTDVSLNGSTVQNNFVNTYGPGSSTTEGSALAVVGGSLTLTKTKLTNNRPIRDTLYHLETGLH
jgi:hypothetical protein